MVFTKESGNTHKPSIHPLPCSHIEPCLFPRNVKVATNAFTKKIHTFHCVKKEIMKTHSICNDRTNNNNNNDNNNDSLNIIKNVPKIRWAEKRHRHTQHAAGDVVTSHTFSIRLISHLRMYPDRDPLAHFASMCKVLQTKCQQHRHLLTTGASNFQANYKLCAHAHMRADGTSRSIINAFSYEQK